MDHLGGDVHEHADEPQGPNASGDGTEVRSDRSLAVLHLQVSPVRLPNSLGSTYHAGPNAPSWTVWAGVVHSSSVYPPLRSSRCCRETSFASPRAASVWSARLSAFSCDTRAWATLRNPAIRRGV